VFSVFFISVLTGKTGLQESQVPNGKLQKKEDLPLVEEDQVREHLNKLDIQKSMRPGGMCPCVLKKLAEVFTMLLLINFEITLF